MEWTIEHHKFMGVDFFTISTPIENGKHTLMVEYKDRRDGGKWVVRDVCDTGSEHRSLLMAFNSYIDRSTEANRSRIGHCGWVMDIGLPALDVAKFDLVNTMLAAYLTEHQGVN